MTAPITDELIQLLALEGLTDTQRETLQAILDHGSQRAAAKALKRSAGTVQQHISRARAMRVALALDAADAAPEAPPVHGSIQARDARDLTTILGATTARYILTAAQNNTPVHKQFLRNLEAYADEIGASIMVSRFSYNKAAYGKKATKAGKGPTAADHEELWYDPAIAQYICDDPQRHGSCRYRLAPDLLWCAEMNILPTAVRPLSGLESYAGSASGVFPHAKIALESVPVIGDRPPKFNYTTGAVTQRNYISKKEGLKGDFHHAYGALLVEVDLQTGDWWARQLNATDDGTFYDLTNRVADGWVTCGHRLLAINWGDVHASEIDPAVRALNWGSPNSVVDRLRPQYQFWHDTFSMRSRSHHELKSFEKRYQKWVAGTEQDLVEVEIDCTGTLLALAHRSWCRTVVVSSNHDRHIERWLDEADYKQDLPNAEFFLEAQLARLQHLKRGAEFNALQWALTRRLYASSVALFLGRDQSFLIGPEGHQIECGSHGDEGPDGSRGNTANLSRMAVRMNKGHDHKATIRDGVCSAGVCHRAKDSSYAHGPSSWSISDIATYENGKRAILTMRGGKKWL